MGEFSRLTGVFFEPAKTFADIAERPRWFVPLLLIVLAVIAFNLTYGQRVGWDRFAQQQLENNPTMQRQMERATPEQREQSLRLQARIIYPLSYYVGPVFGMPLAFLFSALILWGMASGLMSAGVRYKQIFAIICYASLTTIVMKILAVVVVFLKSPEDINFMNPLAFNPGAFMDMKTANKLLYTVGTGLDVFAIWALILEAIGLKQAAGKRLSSGGAAVAVFVPYFLILLFFGAIAAAFS